MTLGKMSSGSSLSSGSLSSGSLSSSDVDMGHPFVNRTVNGFLKISTVGLAKGALEEAWHVAKYGNLSTHRVEHSLKRMCKDGALWGTVAGVYVGMEYGVAKIRGTSDWKNSMVGGALAGVVASAVTNKSKDKIVTNAIAGGALATASVFLNYLTQ